MEIMKLIILLCCVYNSMGSNSHTIPVEEYKTDLYDLGQHIEIPETPVKIIKITKTVAVKVPVPYPVKVVEKVPYPVHVNKPYPVEVPHVVKVPAAPAHKHAPALTAHLPLDLDHYHVHEQPAEEHSYEGHKEEEHTSHSAPSGGGGGSNDHAEHSEGSHGGSEHFGVSGHDDNGSHESRHYQQAIQNFLNQHNLNGLNNYHYH